MSNGHTQSLAWTARDIAQAYARLPQVEAVAWAGSARNDLADAGSDIDLYVYTPDGIDLADRQRIASARGERVEVGNTFWEPGDEWDERGSGIHVDVMFRSIAWIEEQIARLLRRHEASVGYSTCFWHNLLVSDVLFDRDGTLTRLQERARQPYPAALQAAIIAKNEPLLARAHGAYLGQIAKAAARDDVVSLNHRIAALLASYFDILFALNRQPHPGEKRLLQLAQRDCSRRPPMMEQDVRQLVAADTTTAVERARRLIGGLEALLAGAGQTNARD